MEGQILIISTVVLICLVITLIFHLFVPKKEKKKYVDIDKDL